MAAPGALAHSQRRKPSPGGRSAARSGGELTGGESRGYRPGFASLLRDAGVALQFSERFKAGAPKAR